MLVWIIFVRKYIQTCGGILKKVKYVKAGSYPRFFTVLD